MGSGKSGSSVSNYQEDFEPLPDDLVALMTEAERGQYARLLKKQATLASPLDFAKIASPSTKEHAFAKLVNALIVALVEDRLYKSGIGPRGVPSTEEDCEDILVHPETGERVMEQLAISAPPRHGKSYIISEHTPAWFVSRYPDRHVIFVGYEADFAAKYGRRNRDHLLDPKVADAVGILLNPEVAARDEWETAQKGGMRTAGAGGPITGTGYHLGIVDDPIKNDEEAGSKLQQERQEEWWAGTFRTRGEPGAKRLLVMTRWNEADLQGRLLANESDEWFVLNLPALQWDEDEANFEELNADTALHSGSGNPLCRVAGAPLVPARYSKAKLLGTKAHNERKFNALYQGRPSTEGSGVFQRRHFRYWEPMPQAYALHKPDDILNPLQVVMMRDCHHFMMVDLNASVKTRRDYTVFGLFAVTPAGDMLLVHRLKERIDSADHFGKLLGYLDEVKTLGIKVRWIGIEDATYGKTLIKLARRRKLPVRPVPADADKYTRALPAGDAMQGHWVFFPKAAAWLADWEEELTQFPDGAHDDQVDVFSYAVAAVMSGGVGYRPRTDHWGERTTPGEPGGPLDSDPTTLGRKRKVIDHPLLGRLRQ